jgi:hypothetical protein
MWKVCKKGVVYTVFWWGVLMERNHLDDLGLKWGILLKCIFKKWDGETWTELLWLRI